MASRDIYVLLYIWITTILCETLSDFSPIQLTELSTERLPNSCIEKTLSSGVTNVADCAQQCFDYDVGECTNFMIDEGGDCHLSHYCDLRESDEENKAIIYELIRPNNKHYLSQDEELSASGISTLWSASHRFRLYINSQGSIVLSAPDNSVTDNIFASNTYTKLSVSATSLNTNHGALVQLDSANAPYTIHLTDYGQTIIRNKYDVIVWVDIGKDNAYQKDEWERTCAPFTDFGLGGSSSSDGAKLALSIGTAVVGLAGPVGGAFQAAGDIVNNVWDYMDTDDSMEIISDVMECVVDYVDFRFKQHQEEEDKEADADYALYINKLMEEWDQQSTREKRFQLLSEDSVGSTTWTFPSLHEEQELLVDPYLKVILHSIAMTMNTRMYYWGKLMNEVDCSDGAEMSEWIKQNKDCGDTIYYGALLSFRNHNGETLQHYIEAMSSVYAETMRAPISTQERHGAVDAIFMDGIFCMWVQRTYYMSQSVTFDSTKQCQDDAFYQFEDSYVFDPDGKDFSAYVIDGVTYDFTKSYDDCRSQLYSLISYQFTDDNFKYNIQEEFGMGNYGMSTSIHVSSGNWDRCLKESKAYDNKKFSESTFQCGDLYDDNFVYGLKIIIFNPNPNKKSDEFSKNFQKTFPLVKEIEKLYCRKTSSNSHYSISVDDCNSCRLEFFDLNHFDDCFYSGGQTDALKEVETVCPSGNVATGIQYYRGYLQSDYNGAAVYLLWKIRLQCRNIQDDNVMWRLNSFTTTVPVGEDPNGDEDYQQNKLNEVGWTPAFECPPKQAIYKIKADDGWHNFGSDDDKGIKTNWGITIQCKPYQPRICNWGCYLARYSDLLNAFGWDFEAAQEHYETSGWKEGRSCECTDECNWGCYATTYNDLKNTFYNDFYSLAQHYEQSGKSEDRDCTCNDDCNWHCYLERYEDLYNFYGWDYSAAAFHYYQVGKNEDRYCKCGQTPNPTPSPTLDTSQCSWDCYLGKNSDLIAAFGFDTNKAQQHYLESGYDEGRDCTCAIDDSCNWGCYLGKHSDLIAAYGFDTDRAQQHYFESGLSEGRDCTCDVDCMWGCYLHRYSNLYNTYGWDYSSAAAHYYISGRGEGRNCKCDSQSAVIYPDAPLHNTPYDEWILMSGALLMIVLIFIVCVLLRILTKTEVYAKIKRNDSEYDDSENE